jgi:Tfp pilus assembly protein PilZ/ribosome-associated toxin RatA of RatAB toxin-antitoxin module
MLQYDRIRQYPRAPLRTLVKEKSGKGNPFYYSKDICEGGIFLVTRQPLMLGTKLDLMFNLPDDVFTICTKGETVSALIYNDNHGMGVKFTEIGDRERKLIANYVNAVTSKVIFNYKQGNPVQENHAAGSRSMQIELPAKAEKAYRLFCSIDEFHKWQNVLEDIEILEKYQDGKVKAIRCSTSLLIPRKRISLDFLYNEKEKRIFWHSCGGDFTEIRGNAGFDDKDHNSCVMNFFIMVNTGMVIPQKIQEHIADEVLPKTLGDFSRYVKSL